jgi:aspartyl-tRNA(Asn)/glutamyl-tRNA(Gln) amidotransferase subunit B
MEKYFITIGLEIHAELKTNSKMFCSCANVPLEDSPNKNVCPICMAHPVHCTSANQDCSTFFD